VVGQVSGEHLNDAWQSPFAHSEPAWAGSRQAMIVLYGKLPRHGDFLCRGLAERQAQAADRMLTAMLEAAREEWGDDFATRYAEAQPWLWQAAGWSGLIIPSMDAAGRCFPLALAAPVADLQAVYDAAIAAIAEASPVDDLMGELARMSQQAGAQSDPSDEAAATAALGQWFLPDDTAPSLPPPDGTVWSDIMTPLGEVRA
jgi:type VI secretion system ImpM family protein